MSDRWPPSPMSSLVLCPHFVLVWGLVRTWLILVEDSVQSEGSRLCAYLANTPQQRAFLLTGFRSFATGSVFRNAPAEEGRFIIQCKISTTRFRKASLSWGRVTLNLVKRKMKVFPIVTIKDTLDYSFPSGIVVFTARFKVLFQKQPAS